MPLSDEDIREILRIIDETPLAELRLETDGFSLHVVKGGAQDAVAASAAAPARAPDTENQRATAQPRESQPAPAPEPAHTATEPGAAADSTDNLVTIDAPMLGVFYRADSPGSRPFVEPGSHVGRDTTVCIIEVMKMMNSVPAGVAGTVIEVCQENAAIVEEGAPLFRVRPE